MEEDIDILEDFLEYNSFLENSVASGNIREFEIYMSKNDYKAIQNLIARYKELEEINAEHQKLNGELQEKIMELENENHIPRID